MGYRIDYQPVHKIRDKAQLHRPIPAMICIVLLLFLFLTCYFLPSGRTMLQDILLPGDAAVTAAALSDFSENIRAGNSFLNAFEVFCLEILNNGHFASD